MFASLPPMHMPELEAEEEKEKEKSKGPRALRRQKKMYRNKLRRDAIQHIIPVFLEQFMFLT